VLFRSQEINNLLISSPLDQFGADSFGNEIIDFLTDDIFDSLDVLNLNEAIDFSFLQGLVSTFVSVYFYDDDDCADSE